MRVRNYLYLAGILGFFAYPAFSYAQSRAGIVSTSGARIYDRPSVIGEKKIEVPISTAVKVLDAEDEWLVVRIGDVVGWMPASSVSVGSSSSSSGANSSLGLLGNKSATSRSSSSSSSGRSYMRGPRGGCYYINGSGRKVYVDHSYCS